MIPFGLVVCFILSCHDSTIFRYYICFVSVLLYCHKGLHLVRLALMSLLHYFILRIVLLRMFSLYKATRFLSSSDEISPRFRRLYWRWIRSASPKYIFAFYMTLYVSRVFIIVDLYRWASIKASSSLLTMDVVSDFDSIWTGCLFYFKLSWFDDISILYMLCQCFIILS